MYDTPSGLAHLPPLQRATLKGQADIMVACPMGVVEAQVARPLGKIGARYGRCTRFRRGLATVGAIIIRVIARLG